MERKFAVCSIVFALIHFAGETVWHFKFGQYLPMLFVDYIAVSLLVYGGIQTIKSSKAVGLLCGAWGFEFCLNYRTVFGRLEKLMSGTGHGNPAVDTTAYVLSVLLVVSFAMFLISIYFTNKNAKDT